MISVSMDHRACLDISVDTAQQPYAFDMGDLGTCYVPSLREQTVRMQVRRDVGRRLLDGGIGSLVDFDINIHGTRFKFKAHVMEVSYELHLAAWNVRLRPQGQVLIIGKETHMARTTPGKTGIEIPKDMKVIRERRFYVGSKQIFPGGNNADWGHATLEKAVEHATGMVDETGEDQFVVSITRIVRRKRTPVTVEKV